MLKTLLTMLLAIACFMPLSQKAMARDEALTFGTEVPFPFGTEIPFPWGQIEGVWEVKDHEIQAFFSFQVQSNGSGVKVLKVLHIDKVTKQTIGTGAGFADADQKIVRAVMIRNDGRSYMIIVRVYRDPNSSGTATVLTMREFAMPPPEEEQHYILRRVSNSPAFPQ